MRRNDRKNWRRRITLVVGSLLFVLYLLRSNPLEALRQVPAFDEGAVAVLLLLTIGSLGLKYLRWEALLRRQRISFDGVRVRELLAVSAAFFIGLVTPGTSGELSRSLFSGNRSVHTASLVMLEKVTDLLVLLGLVVVAAASLIVGTAWSLLIACLGCLGLLILYGLVRRHEHRVATLAGRILKRYGREGHVDFGRSLYRDFQEALHDPILVAISTLYSLLLLSVPVLQVWIILDQLGLDGGLELAALMFLLPYLAGLVSMIPAGLGAFEISVGGVLALAGVSVANSAISSDLMPLIFRVFVTVPLIAVGYLSLLVLQASASKAESRCDAGN